MKTFGVILSGGKSSRMGTNKSLLNIQGKPVIQHISQEMQTCSDETAIVANDPDIYNFLGVRVISDRYPGKGPLAGIETALYHADADAVMLAACDMPFINRRIYHYLLQQLHGYDAVVPVYDNYMHPLSGIYRKNMLQTVQKQIQKNNLQVKSVFEHTHVNYVRDYGSIRESLLQKHFFNMNNPLQYEEAKWLSQ